MAGQHADPAAAGTAMSNPVKANNAPNATSALIWVKPLENFGVKCGTYICATLYIGKSTSSDGMRNHLDAKPGRKSLEKFGPAAKPSLIPLKCPARPLRGPAGPASALS